MTSARLPEPAAEGQGPVGLRPRTSTPSREPEPLTSLVHHSDFARGTLARATSNGDMERVARGWYTYRRGRDETAWDARRRIAHDRVVALASRLGDDQVISGAHAALLLGGQVSSFPDRVQVLGTGIPSTTKGSPNFRRTVRRLDAEDITVVDGIRVTSPTRTAVEVARTMRPSLALSIADSLMNLQIDNFLDFRDRAPADAVAASFRRRTEAIFEREPRLRGNSVARVVLEYADIRAQTPIESLARHCCLVVGLPRPVLQYAVDTQFGVFFPDMTFTYRTEKGFGFLHVETDGAVKYQHGLDRDAERRRETAIRQLGHQLVRLSGYQITHQCQAAVSQLVLPLFPSAVTDHLTPVRALDDRAWTRRSGQRRTTL